MTTKLQTDRWLNYPERRVGRQQLMRAMAAGTRESDPRYRECGAQLDNARSGAKPRGEHT